MLTARDNSSSTARSSSVAISSAETVNMAKARTNGQTFYHIRMRISRPVMRARKLATKAPVRIGSSVPKASNE